MTDAKEKPSSIVTPVFRLAFPRVFEPTTNRNNLPGFVPRYEITMLFPKPGNNAAKTALLASGMNKELVDGSFNIGELRRILTEAVKKAKWAGKLTEGTAQQIAKFQSELKQPIRDADAEGKEKEGYAGHFFIKAANKNRIPVVDAAKLPVTNPALVYGGMYCRALINAYSYDNVSKGVSFGLQALQLVRDGTPFVGLADPDKAFEAIEPTEGGKDDPAAYAGEAATADPFAIA